MHADLGSVETELIMHQEENFRSKEYNCSGVQEDMKCCRERESQAVIQMSAAAYKDVATVIATVGACKAWINNLASKPSTLFRTLFVRTKMELNNGDHDNLESNFFYIIRIVWLSIRGLNCIIQKPVLYYRTVRRRTVL